MTNVRMALIRAEGPSLFETVRRSNHNQPALAIPLERDRNTVHARLRGNAASSLVNIAGDFGQRPEEVEPPAHSVVSELVQQLPTRCRSTRRRGKNY